MGRGNIFTQQLFTSQFSAPPSKEQWDQLLLQQQQCRRRMLSVDGYEADSILHPFGHESISITWSRQLL